MAQGKMKVKTKLPNKSKKAKESKKGKGPSFSKRANRPIKPKKQKHQEEIKFKQAVTKTVNKSIESEMRAKVYEKPRNLSKAQEAVAKYNATGSTTS